MPAKEQFRTDLPPDLKKRIKAIFAKRGIDRTKGVERIMAWFVEQPQVIQQHILGQLPDDLAPDIARMVLESMNGKTKHPRRR